jgi:hypothetical protein
MVGPLMKRSLRLGQRRLPGTVRRGHGMGKTMGMLERRGLGEAGFTYIRERLAGGRTLSRLLLDGLDLAGGTAWAYLPPAMSDAQATHFAEAGLTRRATGTSPAVFARPDGRWEAVHNLVEPLLAAQVSDFLSLETRGVAVWEVSESDTGDPWIREHPEEPLLFLGEEVYVVLSHSTVSPTAVAAGLEVMSAWWGSPAALAALPAEALQPFLTLHAPLAAEQLHPLVEHCQLLYFAAYDREGYVLWSPRAQHSRDSSATATAAHAAGGCAWATRRSASPNE